MTYFYRLFYLTSLLKICVWLFITYKKILNSLYGSFSFSTQNCHHNPFAISGLLTGPYVCGKANPVWNAFHSWICQLENCFELTLEHKHPHLYEDCSEFTKQTGLLSDLVPYLRYVFHYFCNVYRSSSSLPELF